MFGVFTIDESHFGICNNHFHRLECRDHSQKLLSLLLLVSTASPPQTTAPRAEHFRTMDHFLTDTVPYFTISVSFILCDPEQSFILWYWSQLVVSLFCILKIPDHKKKRSLFLSLNLVSRNPRNLVSYWSSLKVTRWSLPPPLLLTIQGTGHAHICCLGIFYSMIGAQRVFH